MATRLSAAAYPLPSPAERLVLWRRREDLTQVESAHKHGVGMRLYRRWERGEEDGVPEKDLGRVLEHEWCFLLRKRAKMSRVQLADALKCSKLWVTLMEKGKAPVGLLTGYWKL